MNWYLQSSEKSDVAKTQKLNSQGMCMELNLI